MTYLSLLGNPACPDQLSSSEHDEQDYRRYRSYVLHRVPSLRFLDSTAVRLDEREEAQQRGHYYRLIRLNSDSVSEEVCTQRAPHFGIFNGFSWTVCIFISGTYSLLKSSDRRHFVRRITGSSQATRKEATVQMERA